MNVECHKNYLIDMVRTKHAILKYGDVREPDPFSVPFSSVSLHHQIRLNHNVSKF